MTRARASSLWRPFDARPADVAAAAVIGLGFVVYLLALRVAAPPTPHQWARADPILGILPREVTLWAVPVSAVVVAAVWVWLTRRRLAGAIWRRSAVHAIAGLVTCAALVGLLRLVVGPTLPSFIPAEESAGPGFLLSMTAGYAEEVIFRLLLLPLCVLALTRRAPRWVVVALPVVLSGLGFALLHEAGPGPSSTAYFITRLLVPGCAFSLAYFVVSPTFIVTAHAGAHLFIPWWFMAG